MPGRDKLRIWGFWKIDIGPWRQRIEILPLRHRVEFLRLKDVVGFCRSLLTRCTARVGGQIVWLVRIVSLSPLVSKNRNQRLINAFVPKQQSPPVLHLCFAYVNVLVPLDWYHYDYRGYTTPQRRSNQRTQSESLPLSYLSTLRTSDAKLPTDINCSVNQPDVSCSHIRSLTEYTVTSRGFEIRIHVMITSQARK